MAVNIATELYDLRFVNGVVTLQRAAAGKEAYIPAIKFSIGEVPNVAIDIAAAIAAGQHIRVALHQLAGMVFKEGQQSRVVAHVYNTRFAPEAKKLVRTAAEDTGFVPPITVPRTEGIRSEEPKKPKSPTRPLGAPGAATQRVAQQPSL